MKYIEIRLTPADGQLEELTGFLLAAGITDTVVDDPADLAELLNKKEDYEWDYVDPAVLKGAEIKPRITFYLEDSTANRRLASELTAQAQQTFAGLTAEISTEDDSAWKDEWKKYFKPARITERLTVKPTWENYTPSADELVIEIDPGMAFGTGTHETTSLCLALLEKYLQPGERVLDIGCGSGILSIGAALLGASAVLAVDIDPQAVFVSRENVALNGCEDAVRVQQGDLTKGLDFEADLIAANLMADLVIMLSPHAGQHLRRGGLYISSGILAEKCAEVEAAIRAAGFAIEEIRQDGMWCAIAARWQ